MAAVNSRTSGATFSSAAMPSGAHDDADRGDVDGVAGLQQPDGVRHRAAGGQHRVEHHHRLRAQVVGQRLQIRCRLVGFLVAGDADEADAAPPGSARAPGRPCRARRAAPAPAAAGWPAATRWCRPAACAPGRVRWPRRGSPRRPASASGRAARRGTPRCRCARRAVWSAARRPAGGRRRARPCADLKWNRTVAAAVLTACSPTPTPSAPSAPPARPTPPTSPPPLRPCRRCPAPLRIAELGPVGARFLAALADAATRGVTRGRRAGRPPRAGTASPRMRRRPPTTTPTDRRHAVSSLAMPSALVAALAAPIREVQSLVGPGGRRSGGDPAAALGGVRDALADVSAAARRAWNDSRRTLVRRRRRRRGRVRGGDGRGR